MTDRTAMIAFVIFFIIVVLINIFPIIAYVNRTKTQIADQDSQPTVYQVGRGSCLNGFKITYFFYGEGVSVVYMYDSEGNLIRCQEK